MLQTEPLFRPSRRDSINLLARAISDGLEPPPEDATQHHLNFTDFCARFFPNYQHTPYQRAIDDVLMQVVQYIRTGGEEGIGRASFSIPPRHGKTLKISRLFPAWLFGELPDLHLISASYGATLAYRNSRYIRNLIRNTDYQALYPGVKVADDSRAVDQWDITDRQGGMIASGVGGGITGHGANLIIIDDPVKSRAEAESPTFRKRAIDWYNDDLLTRLEEPGGAIIIMQTRWHTDDLTGYLLAGEDDWHALSLPALAGENDPLGREVGEALWPERYSVDILNKRRAQMGEYAFASLYQQTPMPSGGGLFDTAKIQILDYVPDCSQIVRFYDLAVTAKKHSDYTVGLKLGKWTDERLVILDVYRVQKAMPDVQNDIAQNAAIDGTGTRIRLEAEKAGIIQLDYLLRDPRMHNYALDTKAPEGDKYTRATPVASRVNNERVYMVRAHWNRAFLDELAVFPMGEHDDQVDALSGAYEMLGTTSAWSAFSQ